MTRAEANRLLDRVRDGDDVNLRIIRQALEATGDRVPKWRREHYVQTLDEMPSRARFSEPA